LGFDVSKGDASEWLTNRRIGGAVGGYQVLVEKGSDKILGDHLLGHHAAEAINLFGLAIRAGLTRAQVKEAFHAYPTECYDLKSML